MSGFSIGGFSFSNSHRRGGHRRGGYVKHSHSSGRGFGLGGLMGHSHSSGHRGRYVQGGHYRQVSRRSGCLGAFVLTAGLAGGGLLGLVSLFS